MARLARTVVAGYPHHITQRGNRRMPTFFSDDDYEAYLALLAEHCAARGVRVLAWCLMPNHVHLVAVPKTEDGLARALGEAHRRYTRRINFREGWRGHLWQERFFSCVLDRGSSGDTTLISGQPGCVAGGMVNLRRGPGTHVSRFAKVALTCVGRDVSPFFAAVKFPPKTDQKRPKAARKNRVSTKNDKKRRVSPCLS
jgi:REP element-mobilizing transposase RayT